MNDICSWCTPPNQIKLGQNEVHVWRASLNLSDRYLSQVEQILSEDEHLKAERFRFERDKRQFVAGRGVLRLILGHYLCIEPSQLQFYYGPHGKPYLTEEFDESALRFSLAHSHEIAIYAFTLGRKIGIDLEQARILPEAEKIAARLFSTRENAVWLRQRAEQKQDAFYVCWTGKEAYVKALGNGLAQSSGQIAFSLLLRETTQLSGIAKDTAENIHWSIETFVPAPGYIGSLAIEGSEHSLSCYLWSP